MCTVLSLFLNLFTTSHILELYCYWKLITRLQFRFQLAPYLTVLELMTHCSFKEWLSGMKRPVNWACVQQLTAEKKKRKKKLMMKVDWVSEMSSRPLKACEISKAVQLVKP